MNSSFIQLKAGSKMKASNITSFFRPRRKYGFIIIAMLALLSFANLCNAQVTKDTTPPVLIVHKPDTTIIEVTKTDMHPVPVPTVVSADDLVDGPLAGSVFIDSGKVRTSIVGIYKVTYTVSDLSGNVATTNRYVNVIDSVHPVIKLIGSNPMLLEVFNSFTDPGVNASDNYNTAAQLNPKIVTNSNVDVSKLGSYTISYDVTDLSGNKAATVYRTVKVIDSIAPVISINGLQADSIEAGATYKDPGVVFTDNYDKNIDLTLTISGTFYASFPNGKAKHTGYYTIIYTVSDKSGNKVSLTRTVRVVDHTPPVITLYGNKSIPVCQNDQYIDAGYTITDNDTSIKITVTSLGSYITSGGTATSGLYTLRYEAVDGSGNIGYSDYRYILVKSSTDISCKSNTTIDTLICKGTCPTFTSQKKGSSYKWSTGATTKSIQYCPKQDTAISVTITLSGGGTYTYLYNIIVTKSTCVWPGDADYDFKADKKDVLAIGVAYSDSGTKRSGATTDWYGQESKDWKNNFKGGVNHKNADCNGDGTIDSTDMAAVYKNYGYSHTKTNAANGSPSDPPLSITFSSDSAHVGDTVTATLKLGTSANPVKNAYGLSFTISYTSKYVKPNKSTADFSKCWLGTEGKDMITFMYNDTANGQLDIALTRIDHKNVTGYGDLGKLSIVMQDNVGGKTWIDRKIYFVPSDVTMIASDETPISIFTRTDSVKIYQSGLNDKILPAGTISLFPNPVAGNIYLNSGDLEITVIRIMDYTGKTVYTRIIGKSGQIEIPAGQLIPGIYSIIVNTKKGMIANQFVKD
jgi:hypothetical protein